jgi:branched-chain amino acid transport system substrate-binding protein
MITGILYPRSNAHPGMMPDFMDGIKASLKQQQLNDSIQLISESIGFGGNEKEVYEKAEKLLVLEGVDILIAFVDLRVLEILKPLAYASGKLVMVVNPGANYPQNWVPQPNILNLGLQHSFLCWLSGKLAAGENINSAVTATTFYDCGYLHTASVVKKFVHQGGRILYNYVNNQRYDDSFEIKPLTDYLSAGNGTNNLLCVFDSLPASLFYSQLNSFDEAGRLHLFVSPMMLEEKALEKIADGFKFSIDGYMPWHSSLENNANHIFLDSYGQQTKRDATVFSLLGWETGLILQQVFLHSDGNYTDGAEIAGRFAKAKINSPRGEMKLDPETNYFITPVFKCSINQNAGKATVDYIETPEKEWAEFIAQPLEGVSSGWTNTYLCY